MLFFSIRLKGNPNLVPERFYAFISVICVDEINFREIFRRSYSMWVYSWRVKKGKFSNLKGSNSEIKRREPTNFYFTFSDLSIQLN